MTQEDGLSYKIYDRLSKMFVKGIWNFQLFGGNSVIGALKLYERLLNVTFLMTD